MSEAAADQSSVAGTPLPEPPPEQPVRESAHRRRRGATLAGAALLILLGGVWVVRERIADRLIASQLASLGLPATYRIEQIGPRRQVLRDIVIGDPRHPDLTIERAEIELAPRFGWPGIGRVVLVRPRLHGTWNDRKLSFGRLDRLLFGPPGAEPFRLPDYDLTVIDGRARVLGDHGPIGLAFEGRGGLRDGFAGTLAATAPTLHVDGCRAQRATLYGAVTVAAERPGFAGPLRLGALACGGAEGVRLADGTVDIDLRADRGLDGGAARLGLRAGPLALSPVSARGSSGTIEASYRHGNLTARYNLMMRAPDHAQVAAATLSVAGQVRSRGDMTRLETEGLIDARGVRPGAGLARDIAGYQQAAMGTLFEPLLGRLRESLVREAVDNRFTADFVLRTTPQGVNLVLPQGQLTGGHGAKLLALSRLHLATGAGTPRLAGNFATGGAGLPAITGRLEQGPRGQTRVHMAMAEYRAGSARLAVPHLTLDQARDGRLAFVGEVSASGALPGGQAQNLVLPLDGARTADGRLALWRGCTAVRFDQLTLGNLALDHRALSLCPVAGGAIVSTGSQGWRLAVGTPGLDLTGRLGTTPVQIASGPAGYAAAAQHAGQFYVRALDVALGPPATATRLRLSDVTAQVGDEIAGSFSGADVRLAAVPLDLLGAAGQWRVAGGQLTIDNAEFRVEDRAQVDRFQPLQADNATLKLADNHIYANAILREPEKKREVTRLSLVHDLGTAHGHADLVVAGLSFDPALQPEMISRELLGVVANVNGTISGTGRIDWTGDSVTSSGRFATPALDFAAAFGPAKGVSGEIAFTDLLGLVTPPHQRLTIASINPGIEVTGGEMLFQLKPGGIAAIEGGTWPFLGGYLYLRPAEMRFGVAETRRYVIDIENLDAARFLAQMDLANISATGEFDGSMPLVFDADGGRIEGGMLVSRPPGGNLSYIGALTYKDLSPIANFAFDALRSLDYRKMQIAMDGALEGEIVTRVRFDGIKQGQGAKRNFLTQRFARLPLQFNVNLRAPFYGLITAVKTMYDPAYIRDPRTLGLIDSRGRPILNPVAPAPDPAGKPIQPPVSENRP